MTSPKDEITACVTRLLRERLPKREEPIRGDARIRELGLDSVAVMDLVMSVEDEYEVVFPLERLGEIETVDELSAVVRALVAERTAS